MKTFCASKDTIKKVKTEFTEWEKIFTNHLSDKGLVPRTYKEPLQLDIKLNTPIKKLAKDLKRHISKDTQMDDKHMKRCSSSLIIRKMQMKTTMKYYFTLTRMAYNKKDNSKC